jgi:hypothetical protein
VVQRRTLSPRTGVRRPWAMGGRAVGFRLPTLRGRRGQPPAAQPDAFSEVLARLEALERRTDEQDRRQQDSEAKVEAVTDLVERAGRQIGGQPHLRAVGGREG